MEYKREIFAIEIDRALIDRVNADPETYGTAFQLEIECRTRYMYEQIKGMLTEKARLHIFEE